MMQIRAGFDMTFHCTQPTPLLLAVNVHPSQASDLLTPQVIMFDPPVAAREYTDLFGNICTRIIAPPGEISVSTAFVVNDSGLPDETVPDAEQVLVEKLPDDALVFLLGSRYCETDRLSDTAWDLFGGTSPGWRRVQAICDFVHERIAFGYRHARATRTAMEAFQERRGVCRDFAHLAVTLCRCMNIPARYCTGYLGDIGVPPAPAPMDFSAWFDAYLGGQWFTFDARHNSPRIGRILMARGRDATDVAISTAFGRAELLRFHVVTEEVGG
jgi:transglutaminase-like putative cysteine protease